MPSRRADVEMSPDEIRAYLRANTKLILVSNGVGGFPHPMPMNYGMDDEDRIVMTTFRKSQKIVNFRRDPRATILVETGFIYSELKSVVAYAEAEIIDDIAAVGRTMELMSKTVTQHAPQTPELAQQIRAVHAKRVVLRFKPTRYLSWDHAKLKGRY
jgi:nitroimidazol reductase NimA-like FMN-containing flavoprotein (pyridoxamine 5'-phosphate oxidase superfamily)